jgi:hypothetical protein
MDNSQAGGGADQVGRNEAFSQGTTGNPYHVASSLQSDQSSPTSSMGFTPNSVLESVMPTGNGQSSADQAETLPGVGFVGSDDGSDTNTYNAEKLLNMIGRPY